MLFSSKSIFFHLENDYKLTWLKKRPTTMVLLLMLHQLQRMQPPVLSWWICLHSLFFQQIVTFIRRKKRTAINPFPTLQVVTTEVKMENDPCAKCFKPLGIRGTKRPVQCDICQEFWHLECAKLAMPPRYPSWACPRCMG